MYGRPSVFLDANQPSSRASTAPGGPNHNARVRDKQREYDAYLKVLAQSESLVQLFSMLGDKHDVLSGGTEAVSTVVEHWQNVFRVTHLALSSLESQKEPASTDPNAPLVLPPKAMPDRLVRIPVDTPEAQEG